MNRSQILTQYRQRIKQGDRIKLTTQERAALVQDFVARLRRLNTPQAIQQLCQEEIALLEEGYGRGSNSTTSYLSNYRTAIAEAVERGQLTLTHNTISRFTGRKQVTGELTEAVNHLAWSLMRYEASVYQANRKAAKRGKVRQGNPPLAEPEQVSEQVPEPGDAAEIQAVEVTRAAPPAEVISEVEESLPMPSPDLAPNLAPDLAPNLAPSLNPSNAMQAIARQLDRLPDKQPRQMQLPVESEPASAQSSLVAAGPARRQAAQTKPRYKDLAVDVEALSSAAERWGLRLTKGKGRGYELLLAQLLEAVQAEAGPAQAPSEPNGDSISKALTAITQEIAALRQQVQAAQPSRLLADELTILKAQLSQVQQERDKLQAQLQANPMQLDQFPKLAQGEARTPADHPTAAEPPEPAESPEPAKSPELARTVSSRQQPRASGRRAPEERIIAAIDALIRYNEGFADPRDRWFISINAIAEMSGTNPANKVKPWLAEHSEVAKRVQHHNETMGTTRPHHNRGKDKQDLRAIMAAAQG